MISKNDAEHLIKNRLDEDRLKRIIINTSSVAWGNFISEKKVDNWLNNFQGKYFETVDAERKLALWLLLHFSYFTYNDVRILCRNLYNQYLHVKLLFYDGKCKNISAAVDTIINNTIFIGLGNDSESGNNILYYYRQENQLPIKSFELNKNAIENLVYVDDVTISGKQAVRYIKNIGLKAEKIYLATLIATDTALNNIESSGHNITPIYTILLDERERAFSESSYVFSDKKISAIKPYAKEFCSTYGKLAIEGYDGMENFPLGFDDGQYMIGFEYNTPNNTLPIFWGEGNGWSNLFTRHQKIYSGKGYEANGRKFY